MSISFTEEQIKELLVETEARFNEAKVRRDQAEAAFQDAENECMRVQGEYRGLSRLLNDTTNIIEDPTPEELAATESSTKATKQ